MQKPPDLLALQDDYEQNRRPKEIQVQNFHLFLWVFLILPGLIISFLNPLMRGLAWESFVAILLNWGGRRYFGERQFDLHKKLLQKTEPKYTDEYLTDSIKIIKAIFADLGNPAWKPKFFIGNLPKIWQKIIKGYALIHFCCAVLHANTQIFGVFGTIYFTFIVIIFALILFFVNILNEIRLVFGNMKILHHVTFWHFQAHITEDSQKFRLATIGEYFIPANLFLSLIIYGHGLLLAPIISCFSVLVYSSAYPENYYGFVSKKVKLMNRINENLIITPFLMILGSYLVWPELTASIVVFLTFNRPVFELYLPAVILLQLACVYIWNCFIKGKLRLPEDFTQIHSIFTPLGKSTLKVTLSRIILFGVFLGFSIVICLQIIVTSVISGTSFLDILRIIGFMLVAFIIMRGVLTSIHNISKTASQIGTLMTNYTWFHKQDELRVHYWEFVGSPMSLVFPGVVLIPTWLILDQLLPAQTFFFNWSVAMKGLAFVWVMVSLSMIMYMMGTVIFLSILAPHFVWHATALTTIPIDKIDEVKNNLLFQKFRKQFHSMNIWGYLGLAFLILLLIPTLTGVFSILVIIGILSTLGLIVAIYFIISIFVPRFLDRVMVPIEHRKYPQIRTEYLESYKKAKHIDFENHKNEKIK